MRKIFGQALTVRKLLKGVKYSVDYYQREYKWKEKQIRELIDDLSNKFLEEYESGHARKMVARYPHYFLGSIILSRKDTVASIVDGQQRLTSLTLLLTFLRNLQKNHTVKVNVDELIFSESYGEKSFNLDIEERNPAMEALYEGKEIDIAEGSESVRNLVHRYRDIENSFPDELRDEALPYFTDWLLDNVHLVEITAYSAYDAYTIFETMNDRGLSLSPTDMLKGYLLANMDESKRAVTNTLWRKRILELQDAGKEVDADFFKAWLRSQYATKIRERKRGAKPEDFDRIGTEFHRWLRNSAESLGLRSSYDFFHFVDRNFKFYSRQYLRLIQASETRKPSLERIHYNAQHGFTLQHMLLLAPLLPEDDPPTIDKKMGLVAHYLDILLTWRLWNFRSIAYSTMQYAMFLVLQHIRGLSIDSLAKALYELLDKETETFASNDRLHMHQQNRYALHRILARITEYIEVKSGLPSRYTDYTNQGKTRYEVEHIWADHWERHREEFQHPEDFATWRNRFGGLLLLPKSFNSSYGDLPYDEKLPHYNSQNLLARSLNELCYAHNPGFLRFCRDSRLPFGPHNHFFKRDLEERGRLCVFRAM